MHTTRPLEGRWAKYDLRAEVGSMLAFMSVPEALEAAQRKQSAHLLGGHGSAWWGKISRILETSYSKGEK